MQACCRSRFVDFSGRRVGFHGTPGGYYNLIEDANHRVRVVLLSHLPSWTPLKGRTFPVSGMHANRSA